MGQLGSYEGSEKKLELTFNLNAAEGVAANAARVLESLRDLPRTFWASVVDSTGAKIISELSSSHVDAYLLSESSLFVFKDRVVMITCGRTQLINAVQMIINQVGVERVNAVYFERKNEAFPQGQLSTFDEDAEVLKSWFADGQVNHIEYEAVGGYIRLFHYCKNAPAPDEARTIEILMHDLDPAMIKQLRDRSKTNRSKLSRTFHFQSIFPNFLVNEFWFDQGSYSLNAVSGSEYFTLHITPEEDVSYVSLETNKNFSSDREFKSAIQTILKAFKPRVSLLVQFHHEMNSLLQCHLDEPGLQVSQPHVLDLPPCVKFSYHSIVTTAEMNSTLYQHAPKRNSVWINQ
jgi:S-adenosylmethionine decarboxylase